MRRQHYKSGNAVPVTTKKYPSIEEYPGDCGATLNV